MPILIGAQSLSKTYGTRPLFQGLSFAIETGERIGLIGPNGAGKSTLLRILAQRTEPDEGSLSVQRGLNIAYLEQVPFFQNEKSVLATVLEGAADPDDWETIARAQELLSKLELGVFENEKLENLSGGWKKRVAIARELLKQPDLFLLDEPTNHLDVESILWLEEFLARAPFATLTITHDRVFLQKVSNRILEINRRYPNGLLSVQGDYLHFLEAKEGLLAAQEARETKLQNTLRRETEWLRQGAKARTTKQQARIQRAGALSEEVKDLVARNAQESTRFDFQGIERNPKRLLEAKAITKSYHGQLIIPPTSLLIGPKSRIGLLGANGSGKSTFIRILLKRESPDSGTVFHSESLKVSYFEQNRESLDPERSVLKTICPAGDHVVFGGRSVHIRSYLERFLFTGSQVEMPVGRLSGGEQSRVLLARLMLEECNLLVLDEPTNDLDMTTLDLLQEVLQEFNGAVLLVSHDRYFLDQVSRQMLGFGRDARGNPEIVSFANLAQWEAWRERREEEKRAMAKPAAEKPRASEAPASKKKLSYKEQRELDGMEAAIESAESKLAALTQESEKPELAANAKKLTELTQEMSALQTEIERLYARWAELSERASG
jgi:ATP-binding cassette subfamily F protein uup